MINTIETVFSSYDPRYGYIFSIVSKWKGYNILIYKVIYKSMLPHGDCLRSELRIDRDDGTRVFPDIELIHRLNPELAHVLIKNVDIFETDRHKQVIAFSEEDFENIIKPCIKVASK